MGIAGKAAVAAMIVLVSGAALAAPSDADRCEAKKNKTVGSYYACRQKAESTANTKGTTPDYTKCVATFTDKWDGAEGAGAGACPDNVALTADIEGFLRGQADEAAAIVAGTGSIPGCGDGTLNAAGEHCDGSALDGKTCETFGLHGTLACSAGCDFDLSGCEPCPSPAVSVEGACWLLGAVDANCNAACATLGLVYDEATSSMTGTGGTNEKCIALLELTGAPGVGLDAPDADCVVAGLGCAVNAEFGFRAHCISPPTDASGSDAGVQRVCACH